MNKGERVFPEIVRVGGFGKGTAKNELRYLDRCAKRRAKVFLLPKDNAECGKAATAALRVRLVVADKLLVCRSSPSLAANGNRFLVPGDVFKRSRRNLQGACSALKTF